LGQSSGLGVKAFVAVACRVSFLPAMATLHVLEWIGGVIAFGSIAFVFPLCSSVSFSFLGARVVAWGSWGVISLPFPFPVRFPFARPEDFRSRSFLHSALVC
jgi:hypothetical protein